MHPIKIILCHLIFFFPASYAFALELGEINVLSNMNEPLEVKIEINLLAGEDISDLKIILADSDAFLTYEITRLDILDDFVFNLYKDENDVSFILISTSKPIVEPFVNILFDIESSTNQFFINRTLLIDPALYKVQPGDTFWSIANFSRNDIDITVNQMMLALYRLNPSAFIGNMNGLQAGAILRIPNEEEISLVSAEEANAEVVNQNTEWRSKSFPQLDVDLEGEQSNLALSVFDSNSNNSFPEVVDYALNDLEINNDQVKDYEASSSLEEELTISDQLLYLTDQGLRVSQLELETDLIDQSNLGITKKVHPDLFDEEIVTENTINIGQFSNSENFFLATSKLLEDSWVWVVTVLISFILLILVWMKPKVSGKNELKDTDALHTQTIPEVETKLELARAYINIGDFDVAKSLLLEVIDEGTDSQRQQANDLLP
ncbi:MAG: FimV/HubP family polar landmark protein [Pseudomonadota bacterium]|nr:FimV/HubP family polar landmark protein [Pseudomonadota bacterium]